MDNESTRVDGERQPAASRAAGSAQPPRVVIVGPATKDVFPDRESGGGAVRFGARVVEAFGERAGLVVLDAGVAEADPAFEAHEVCRIDGGEPLIFELRPAGDGREMRLVSRPRASIAVDALPAAWRVPDLLALAPLLPDDIDVDSFLEARPNWTLVLAQGLLRSIASDGLVRPLGRLPERLERLAGPNTVLALSIEETAGWAAGDVERLAAAGAIVLLTAGSAGAEVITAAERFHVDPQPARVIDTTGAGDVFATAFACALALDAVSSLREAGQLAAQFAAAAIESVGPAALPSMAALARRAGSAAQAIDAGAAG